MIASTVVALLRITHEAQHLADYGPRLTSRRKPELIAVKRKPGVRGSSRSSSCNLDVADGVAGHPRSLSGGHRG